MTARSLECRSVTHRYGQGAVVLDNVSFGVRAGEIVAIVGASGSGKSTLLRVLAGLLVPASGTVLVDDQPVTGQPGNDRAMVFQADRLYPWRTTVRNASFGLELHGLSVPAAVRRALGTLGLVGLSHHAGHYPHELSGGMRQRVNVARALTVEPQFLLMDEPFSALDAQTRELMQLELLNTLERTGNGVVFVTHMIEEAVYLGDRVVVLGARPGRIRRELAISLERPRPLSVKRQPQFQAWCDLIWREIESDVRTTIALEQQGAPALGEPAGKRREMSR